MFSMEVKRTRFVIYNMRESGSKKRSCCRQCFPNLVFCFESVLEILNRCEAVEKFQCEDATFVQNTCMSLKHYEPTRPVFTGGLGLLHPR